MYEELIKELKNLASKADPTLDDFKKIHNDINKYKERLQRLSEMEFREKQDDEIKKDVRQLRSRLNNVIEKRNKAFGRSQDEIDAIEKIKTIMRRVTNLDPAVTVRYDIPKFFTKVSNFAEQISRGGFERAFRVGSRGINVPPETTEEEFVLAKIEEFSETIEGFKIGTESKAKEIKTRYVNGHFSSLLESADNMAIRFHPDFETKDVRPVIDAGRAKTLEKYLLGDIDKVRVDEIVKEFENLIAQKWMRIDNYKSSKMVRK